MGTMAALPQQMALSRRTLAVGEISGARGTSYEEDKLGRRIVSNVGKGVLRFRKKEQRENLLLQRQEREISRKFLTSGQPWRSRSHISASLGFTADPRVGIERAANGLLKDAAMLLLYQEVFKSPPAQAFLKVLLGLRRGEEGAKILEAYGEFFKLMAISRCPSWEDYILEGILTAEKNPFAEAAAGVGNPRGGIWSSGVPPSLCAAAAADLDSLQRLSITESTLSGWVADVVADVRPEWRAAAALNFSSRGGASVSKSKAAATRDEVGNMNHFGLSIPESAEVHNSDSDVTREDADESMTSSSSTGASELDGFSLNSASASWPYTGTSRSAFREEREMWRKKIGGLWRWSEAVPLLQDYYSKHSVGRLASTQFLQWKGGKMAMDPRWMTSKICSACEMSVHKTKRDSLLTNLTRHAQKRRAQHVLLTGPSGSAKSWLLKSTLHAVASSTGHLRIVTLPVGDLKSISVVLDELARHWQLRFALVVDDLMPRIIGGEDNYPRLKSALDGNGPDNVLLCATTCREVTSYGDLEQLFGLTLRLEELNQNDYLLCVRELMKHQNRKVNPSSTLPSEAFAAQAETWANKIGGRSVRTAAQFVNALD